MLKQERSQDKIKAIAAGEGFFDSCLGNDSAVYVREPVETFGNPLAVGHSKLCFKDSLNMIENFDQREGFLASIGFEVDVESSGVPGIEAASDPTLILKMRQNVAHVPATGSEDFSQIGGCDVFGVFKKQGC